MRHARHSLSTAVALASLAIASCHRSAAPDRSPTPFLEEESEVVFDEIDADGDGRIAFDAFHRGLTVHYYFRQGLDLDGDGVLHPIELTTALYELWDVDDDGSLSPGEWQRGVKAWFPGHTDITQFDDWDTSADGTLSMVELGEGALRYPLFEPYDANHDGAIEPEEASRYLFEEWDTNGDGTITRDEWPLP